MKYRIKQKVFKKSLDAILLEARKEIIEESSSDESDDTYVASNQDNTYEIPSHKYYQILLSPTNK